MNFSFATKQNHSLKALMVVLIGFVLGLFAWLFFKLPDPSIFNANVERIFIETDFISQTEIKLLEVLASSGSLFESSLQLQSQIIFTLMTLTFALAIVSAGLLFSNLSIRQQFQEFKSHALMASSIALNRDENMVVINEDRFTLTRSNIDTLALFMEARMDADYLSGVDLEAMISGKSPQDCEEAAGVMRIKRLRDALGNQIISELLVRHVPGKGYFLDIPKDRIKLD
ncbi:MAG: hypothetical protein QMC17_01060 [Paracoccaceae bacterium]